MMLISLYIQGSGDSWDFLDVLKEANPNIQQLTIITNDKVYINDLLSGRKNLVSLEIEADEFEFIANRAPTTIP